MARNRLAQTASDRGMSGPREAPGRTVIARACYAIFAVLLSSCVVLTTLPRAVVQNADGSLVIRSIPCGTNTGAIKPARDVALPDGLDPRAIRVLTWNIHKEGDAGWDRDLARFSAANDLVLLQEAVLSPALLDLLESQTLRFTMASSFLYQDTDVGVLTAARVLPVASCTELVIEPWLRIPKSATVAWFALKGTTQTLAVVNVHAVNFALSVDTYREQFDGLVTALRNHDGPIIFAGDFNTWTDARVAVVLEAAAALRVTAIPFTEDLRSVFLGHQLDYMLVRGLDVVQAAAIAVKSSDHNPVTATLRLRAP
jgi:endonuclease/exonuclease/phosphatase (EEP) superfamily protein YafD